MRLPALTTLPFILLLTTATMQTRAQDKDSTLDINKIIREIDQLYRSNSSYAELEMEIVTPHWQRTLAMNGWTIGMDKTFIRITSPKKEQGVSTLRIRNEMWNYLPKTNKVIKVPPSMMMSSWMGSDFTNDDLVKEFSLFEDYHYEQIFPEDAEEGLIYVNCIPREDLPVVWRNVIIVARESDHIPVRQEYYDEEGTLMRVLNYRDVKTFDGRTIPATMEIVPQHKAGHKTIIRYLTLKFDLEIDEDIFSLRNLRSAQ
jgi:outer membrane lipoprotein-sorting protein